MAETPIVDQGPKANYPDAFKRLETLLRDLGRQQDRIYRGESIPAPEALPVLARAFSLVEACCGFSDFDSLDDVMEAIDDAV